MLIPKTRSRRKGLQRFGGVPSALITFRQAQSLMRPKAPISHNKLMPTSALKPPAIFRQHSRIGLGIGISAHKWGLKLGFRKATIESGVPLAVLMCLGSGMGCSLHLC